MQDEILFRELKIQGKPISECELIYKDNYDNLRLYVLKDLEAKNFWAKLVEFSSCKYCSENDVWFQDDLIVEEVIDVTAYWDGIRHVFINDMNYPDVLKISEVFKVLSEIEDQVCQETSRSPIVKYNT